MKSHAYLYFLPILAAALATAACGGGSNETDGDAAADGDADEWATDGNGDADEPDDGPDEPGSLVVWTVGTATKVQPTTTPGPRAEIHVEGPRGSYAAHQIVICAEEGNLRGVELHASELDDGGGNVLESGSVTMFRQDFIDFEGIDVMGGSVPVPANSPASDGRVPDPLIPLIDPYDGGPLGQPFDMAPDSCRPIWVDIRIPGSAAAGTYSGAVSVSDDSGADVDVPLTVEVWDLVLPDMRTVTTHFRLMSTSLIYFHRDMAVCSGDDCYMEWSDWSREMVKRYEELVHEHRVETGQQFVPVPHSGCTPPDDWSGFEAAVGPYMDGTYWSDGVPSSVIGAPFSPGVSWGLEGGCSQAGYTAMAQAYASHYKDKGWFDRAIVYSYDEPPGDIVPQIALHSSWMQDGDPDWKAHVMATTEPSVASVDILNPALGIYCVALKQYDSWYWTDGDVYGREGWQDLFDLGIRLWFYESNAQGPPYPTFATNTLDGAEPRIMMWGSWYEGATGFLYWATIGWNRDDPWGPAIDFNKTGDGVLVYPGHHDGVAEPLGSPPDVTLDGPIPSYRLKMLRAGLQDWALFALAEQEGVGDYAREQVARAYWRLGGCTWAGCDEPPGGLYWNTDEDLISEIRRNIADAIMAL